jgi:hypothetical protein
MSKKSVEDLYPELAQRNAESISHELIKIKRDLEIAKRIIREHGLEGEMVNQINAMSAEEKICIDGISGLAKVFQNSTFTKDDAAIFDILNKNLRLIRGQSVDGAKKSKKASKAELFNILELAKVKESNGPED